MPLFKTTSWRPTGIFFVPLLLAHIPLSPLRAGDLVLFWAIDGGVEMIQLLVDYGVDLNAR